MRIYGVVSGMDNRSQCFADGKERFQKLEHDLRRQLEIRYDNARNDTKIETAM